MDQEALVRGGQALIRYLDETPVAPRLAMWVNFSETGSWRLWIVPRKGFLDKREFYRIITTVLNAHPEETQALDVSSVEMVGDDRPVVRGIKDFRRGPNIIAARMSGNTVNGVYVPDGVLLRSNL